MQIPMKDAPLPLGEEFVRLVDQGKSCISMNDNVVHDPSFDVSTGDPTCAIRRRYMQGECMRLAVTLHARGVGDIVGVHDAIWDKVPRHVAIRTPDGRIVDASGIHDQATFLSMQPAPDARIAPISLQEMRAIWGHRVADWTVPQSDLDALELA